jgi:molecular chaperone GrpE (heat shock protein)
MADPKDADVKVVDRRWWARGETDLADPETTRKPTYVEDLEQQLAGATAQLQAVLTEHRRAQQDFEEARARLRREVSRDVERARRAVLSELLEVLDNLDRAVSAAADSSSAGSGAGGTLATLIHGMALVRHQFLAKLEQFGVTRLEALGRTFDAAQHEAVSTIAVTDASQEGVVVGVVKEGYNIRNELLRPASVVVGRAE